MERFGVLHRYTILMQFWALLYIATAKPAVLVVRHFVMVLCNPPNGDRRLGVLEDIDDPALLRSSSYSRNTRLVGGLAPANV